MYTAPTLVHTPEHAKQAALMHASSGKQRKQDGLGTACSSSALGSEGYGILTDAPDDPGDAAQPPIPPGHAIIVAGVSWGRGGRLELVLLGAHGSRLPQGPGAAPLPT